MPPQQPDRLLDGIDIRLGFGAHGLISSAHVAVVADVKSAQPI
jgi:hypothetical protein